MGTGISGIRSLMDDFLLFSLGINEVYAKTLRLLLNAVMHGWVFSMRKFRVGTQLDFCGLHLEANSAGKVILTPSSERIAALVNFPSPQNRREVKSLIGLLNTFSKHMGKTSELAYHIMQLAKESNAFIWTEMCEAEMVRIREVAARTLPLRPFCITNHTRIYTDASHMGLGFAMTQVDPEGEEYFVMCGSCSCTKAMLNYSCLELELQALVLSLKKCSSFLMALDSFICYTVQRPRAHPQLQGAE